MDEILLSVKNLSVKWQRDEETIRRYVKEGILSPCKRVPGIMFHPRYIAQLEGVELERFSPLEKRRLENDIERLKKENEQLKIALREYQVISAKSLELLV